MGWCKQSLHCAAAPGLVWDLSGPYSIPKQTPAKLSPGRFALEMLIGKPAHPEQMENLILVFLWLQGSACLDKACNQQAGVWGLPAAAAGRQGPTGTEPRGMEVMQLQEFQLELHTLETTGRNVQGEGWKTIASSVWKHPPARRRQGEFKNRSEKGGGERYFILPPTPVGTLGTNEALNDSLPRLPPAWAHTWAPPKANREGKCAWARHSKALPRELQTPK